MGNVHTNFVRELHKRGGNVIKKFVCIVLAAGLCLSLAACGGISGEKAIDIALADIGITRVGAARTDAVLDNSVDPAVYNVDINRNDHIGAEVLILISIIFTYCTPQHAVVFNLHTLLPIIIYAPVMSYMYRKLYKMTGNVWAGAIMVALLLGWRLSSYISHQFIYWGPNELAAFWGIY